MLGEAGEGSAVGRWDPEVGTSGIEDDGEVLGWGSDGDWAIILGVLEVLDWDVRDWGLAEVESVGEPSIGQEPVFVGGLGLLDVNGVEREGTRGYAEECENGGELHS